MAAPVYIPTNSVQGSLFSTSWPALIIFDLLTTAILLGVTQYLIVVLICISLVIRDVRVGIIHHVPVGHLYVFLGKMSVQALYSFFNLFFSLLSFMNSLYI